MEEEIQKFEDIDLDNLVGGDSIICEMHGAQGVDGSKYDLLCLDEHKTKIIRR